MTDTISRLKSVLEGCETLMEDLEESLMNLKKTIDVVEDTVEDLRNEMYKRKEYKGNP